jgi:DNA-binding phage protein
MALATASILDKLDQPLCFYSVVEIKAPKSKTFPLLRNTGQITGVKPMPKSVSYRESLIARLKNSEYAAGYIEAILEEEDPEPELLKHALQDVAQALGEKRHLEKLERLLSVEGSAEIYQLGLWLNELGLKLSVSVKSDNLSEDN